MEKYAEGPYGDIDGQLPNCNHCGSQIKARAVNSFQFSGAKLQRNTASQNRSGISQTRQHENHIASTTEEYFFQMRVAEIVETLYD